MDYNKWIFYMFCAFLIGQTIKMIIKGYKQQNKNKNKDLTDKEFYSLSNRKY